MRKARRQTAIRVTASRNPLSTEERDLLIGDLTNRRENRDSEAK